MSCVLEAGCEVTFPVCKDRLVKKKIAGGYELEREIVSREMTGGKGGPCLTRRS